MLIAASRSLCLPAWVNSHYIAYLNDINVIESLPFGILLSGSIRGKQDAATICIFIKRSNMYSVQFLFRIAKTISVAAIALMALLVVIGNTTDYYTNYHFVEHVLKMDTVFPDSDIHYRNIDNPLFFHLAYIFIIAMEAAMAFCCIKGSWLLFKNLKSSAANFHSAKNWAVAGIIVGILTWFLGFEVIGGEWFAMWQSSQWNGLSSAERISSFLMFVLILLHMKEGDDAHS